MVLSNTDETSLSLSAPASFVSLQVWDHVYSCFFLRKEYKDKGRKMATAEKEVCLQFLTEQY